MCSCLKALYQEEQIRELSNLLNLGSQTFDSFEMELYSNMPWPGEGISPRDNMEMVRQICWDYANKFGKYQYNNLFLSGGTGPLRPGRKAAAGRWRRLTPGMNGSPGWGDAISFPAPPSISSRCGRRIPST
jgi:hypothetical protein